MWIILAGRGYGLTAADQFKGSAAIGQGRHQPRAVFHKRFKGRFTTFGDTAIQHDLDSGLLLPGELARL